VLGTNFVWYPQVGARADSSAFLEKFPPAVQEKVYNPSACVTLDPEPNSTLPQSSPVHTPAEVVEVPLIPNRGPPS